MSDLSYRSSFAPGARVGYETVRGQVAWSAGAMVRYTPWRLPSQLDGIGTHSTLETMAFGRATWQLGRARPYVGAALGADTNFSKNNISDVSVTAMGFGMNLMGGVVFAATPSAAFDLGVDYHPGTDTIDPEVDASISYFAVRFGASLSL
jgi:hypothetical protein